MCTNIRRRLSTATGEVPYDRAMDSLIEPTALENVGVPLELAGNPEASRRAAQELTSVGLGDRLHHYPTQLSGGEQQRVALARALAPDPAILVADEPTGNLDEATGKQIVDLLFTKHAERGMTLVLVTHDASLAHPCDRLVRTRSVRAEEDALGGQCARGREPATAGAHWSNSRRWMAATRCSGNWCSIRRCRSPTCWPGGKRQPVSCSARLRIRPCWRGSISSSAIASPSAALRSRFEASSTPHRATSPAAYAPAPGSFSANPP